MIGLVVVSHSRTLADGVVELAGQMAPDVRLVASGGDGSGGLGTDFVAVSEAIAAADSGGGVVVLYDLGSARMVADMAAEEAVGDVLVVDAPLVEGAVAAAVAAQGGADLPTVADAARGAVGQFGDSSDNGSASSESAVDGESAEIVLTNEVGLHARPAALVVRSLAGLDAQVVVRFGDERADAASVLALMGLGAPGGATVEVSATGPDAAEAVRRVRELAGRDFDE
ncbi:dihydroxyacetone kinase phosphoryl donor subunit DhaM [Actinosynnema sp. NPDC047251]|uniref:Phosphocarrier protein HPr n=1 Tax=Saccharothrix espanaensis (strain ATCC 51144 / DSM 44229 / JCM 9112 / NBRC 15066 / NRRL 15764) TaxID=1179773 RepID=K0KCP9_SACES|nr:dihydroxyacetone kinase phosphoryl donor subunit DhaM [Saccharothrix espanaensis]CCH34554.1 PTS-dependent dihydroxyacetone kinase,phosphotransferase subunit [Saccharothrix espanaensis DSM 44229]